MYRIVRSSIEQDKTGTEGFRVEAKGNRWISSARRRQTFEFIVTPPRTYTSAVACVARRTSLFLYIKPRSGREGKPGRLSEMVSSSGRKSLRS